MSRQQYATDNRLIRVMCSGRVDLEFVLRAFSNGIDGVIIGGCHLNECNYDTNGNYYALNMVLLAKKLIQHIGLNPDRLRIEFMSSSDGNHFAEVMTDFSNQIKTLGPLGSENSQDKTQLKEKLDQLRKLVPYIKVETKEKLATRLEDKTAYDQHFTSEEINKLLTEVATYYIQPDKCQACTICAQRCPVDAIISAKNQIHVIDQEKCIKCGNCLKACPPRFGAVTRLNGQPAPPPLPESERTIVRKKEA